VGAVEVDLRELTDRLAPLGVDDLRPLPGGASSLTYAGVAGGGDRRVVVKVAPAGLPPVRNRDVLRQARLLRALGPTAVPVPEVLWEDPGTPPDVPPLFVMAHVDGVSLEPLFDLDADARTGDDDPAVVAERLTNAARAMTALHTQVPSDLDLGDEPRVGPADEADRWCALLATVDPALAPGWEFVAEALRATEPPALPDAVVHGDFRLGNLLAVGSQVTAVIDWEIWSIGDPRVDVGWFLLNADPTTYDRPTRYVGALPTPTELADEYAATLGTEVPDLAWFEALACFKSVATWALIVKHNRRRADPDPALEAMAGVLPRLLERAEHHLGRPEHAR
jgi:aminoglycoside phosphotransferase (APT) family kinase protein